MSRLPDFSPGAPPRRTALPLAERLWLAAGGLLLALALVAGLRERQELDLARQQLERARLAAQAAEERARVRAERLEPAEAELRAQARLGLLAPPTQVLAELQAVLPGGVRCERIALSYGSQLLLELAVMARSARDYDRFLAALEASPRFTEVVPGRENRDGEVRSALKLRYVPATGNAATRAPGAPEAGAGR